MLKVHEFIAADGETRQVFLCQEGDQLVLVSDDGSLPLPVGALRAVMARYGTPFDPEARSTQQGTLALACGAKLHHVRHLAGYDVIARDYLVYEEPGQAALCVMATTVAGALRHLGRAAERGS
jgi:hypothetical protein